MDGVVIRDECMKSTVHTITDNKRTLIQIGTIISRVLRAQLLQEWHVWYADYFVSSLTEGEYSRYIVEGQFYR